MFAGDVRRVPAEATDLLRAYVRGGVLAPVARLLTIRSTVDLTDELGLPVAQVVDDEVSVMDGRRVASRFRELELELAPGADPTIADAVIERLRAAGAGPVDNIPKIRRALGPRADAPADVVVPIVSATSTVDEVVRRALALSAIRSLRHDAGVRLGEDPEDVHQARVATRRLRSDLRTFRRRARAVVRRLAAGRAPMARRRAGRRPGCRRPARATGPAGRLAARSDRAAAGRLLARLGERRDVARGDLLAAMAEPRYVELLDALVAAAGAPALVPEVAGARASDVLRLAPASPWKHLRNAIGEARDDPADAALHAARIRAKRARYAAEALAPVFGKRAEAFADAAAALQGVLGEHQDAVVAGAWLREAAAATPRLAFVAGELAALESAAAREARASWPDAWKAVSRKRLRFWA